MFIDEDPSSPPAVAVPAALPARDLLAACAAEAERQAGIAARIDAALGAALAAVRQAAGGSSAAPSPAAAAALAAGAADLQRADLMRQELAGLASALALLARHDSLETEIPILDILDCTPLGALRQRLLYAEPQGAPQPASPDRP